MKKTKKTDAEQSKTLKDIQEKQANGEKLNFTERNILNIYKKREKSKKRILDQITSGLTENQIKFPYK
jgi:hypothetical protein